MSKAKVMMVDDSDVVLEAGRIALEENGFEVITLDNPLLVAVAVRREAPDLVLLDVNMPALKGDAVTKIITGHGLNKRIPVVLYSDISLAELEKRARECGATGFLRKTNDEEEFIRQVREWLKNNPKDPASPGGSVKTSGVRKAAGK
jgi:CheY-like chemotaxis protein